jgi:hypothetical protein
MNNRSTRAVARNSFRICTEHPTGLQDPTEQRERKTLEISANHYMLWFSEKPPCKSFRMRTCKSVSKQRTSSPFRMNTYKKTGGRGVLRLTWHSIRTPIPCTHAAEESSALSLHPISHPARQSRSFFAVLGSSAPAPAKLPHFFPGAIMPFHIGRTSRPCSTSFQPPVTSCVPRGLHDRAR